MGWSNFSLAAAGSASPKSGIVAVSRIPNSMELWWIGQDGSIQGADWYQGANWQRYQLAPKASASLTSGIAVVSRMPNSMELWSVGADGSIQDHYWYEGSNWQSFTLATAGSASLTSGITAVSRIPNSMELWWVGQDGSIQGADWYQGGNWQRYQLAPKGSASPTTGIAAVSRIPNSMELWWVGPDGSIQGADWYQGGSWQRYQLAPKGSASLTSGIAVVSRVPNSMELWFVGQDGSIQDYYWYEGSSWQNFTLAPRGSASPTSGIAAVSRVPNSMELWFVGAAGSIQDYYWYEGGNWQSFQLAPSGSASLTSGIAAVSRVPNSMELWSVAAEGSVLDDYWYQDSPVNPTLWSSNNSILVNGCQNLQDLTVTLRVTQDLITLGNTGFSLQLNSYPQIGSKAQGTPQTGDSTLTWFQYILIVANNQVTWEIQYWANNAHSYQEGPPKIVWPPGYSPSPPNTTPWLPVFPNTAITGTVPISAPSNQVPAGSILKIQLATDTIGNVTGATFSITDPSGAVHPDSTKPWSQYANSPQPPQYALYPIYGFEADLVGTPSSNCTFISGAGTLTYSINQGTLSVQSNTTSCGGLQPGTAEQSNAVYGNITPSSGSTVSQSLTIIWQGTAATPGSALDGYWGSDNSQHVNFVSLDGHVHELYIYPGAAGWVDNDLTAMANGTAAASGSALDGYWGSDSSQHVNFISLDGHVHELYTHPGAANWVDNDLTAMANGTAAASGSALDGYWGSDSSQHVNFISLDGHVHELYIHPGAANWVDNDLTAMANGTAAASGSALDGYWGSDSSQHVNFISLDGHVHELYTHPGAANWVDNDLTATANGTAAASGSALDGYWGSDSSQHVNFISLDGHVHELYTHPGAANWVDNDLTVMANGTLAALARPDSSGRSHTTARGTLLDGYWGSDNSQHVNFISLDGHVHELYTHPGAANWVDNDLSGQT